ncbi:MAG: YcxB family protein [Acidobacteriaceae bacterium]
MQINYAGQISRNEYLKALKLHYRQLNFLKWASGIFIVLLIFSMIVMLIQEPAQLAIVLRSSLPGGLIFLAIITLPWWIPYTQLTSLKQPGNIYRNKIYGSIDEDGIAINGETVKASAQWRAYVRYRLSDDLVLLYQGKNNLNIFTRSMFSTPGDWDNFISLVKNRFSMQK